MLQLEMQDGILSRAVMPQIKTKTLSDHTEPIGRGEKKSLFANTAGVCFTTSSAKIVAITFIKVCIIFCMLREGETICDFKSVIHHKTQQHSLDHFIPLSFFLVMFNDL